MRRDPTRVAGVQARPIGRFVRFGDMPTSRLEAFTDGVFAIIGTLLIFSIQVPHISGDPSIELPRLLINMLPKFLSYALSFGVVSVWWVAHHHLMALVARTDRGLLWLNCFFLLWLAAIPFPTSLLGDYPNQRISVVCYGGVMAMAGLSFSLMRCYVFYIAGLSVDGLDPKLVRRAMMKSALNPGLHVVAVLVAWIDVRASLVFFAAIPLLFMIPTGLEQAGRYSPQAPNENGVQGDTV